MNILGEKISRVILVQVRYVKNVWPAEICATYIPTVFIALIYWTAVSTMKPLIFIPADYVNTLRSITLKKVSEEGKWLVFEMGPPSYKKLSFESNWQLFSHWGHVTWDPKALVQAELFPFRLIQQSVGPLKGLLYDSVGT